MATLESEDARWMHRALAIARNGGAKPGCNPIGCVIVRDGVIIGEGYNQVGRRCDPTAHSEIVAIRNAGQNLQCVEFRSATLYSTLQPCGMCSMASIWAKIGRIVFGAGRGQVHDMYFEDRHMNAIDFICDAYRDDLSLQGGILAVECAALCIPPGAPIPIEQQFNR